MKVIYLDIDQVLNCHDDNVRLHDTLTNTGLIPDDIYFFSRGDYVVRNKLERLQRIVKKYDAKVVIVSSWDTFKNDGEKICRFLSVPYHSDAFNTGGGIERGRGVKKHAETYGINKEDYIIIDDAGHQMYEDHDRLIHVNGRIGLSDDDESKISNIWG